MTILNTHAVSAVAVFFLLLGLFSLVPVQASTVDELQNKIAAKNNDILNLEKEIAAFQAQLDTLGKQKQSLQNAVQTLDVARKKMATDIAVTENKIEATDFHLSQLALEITDKETRILKSEQAVSSALRTLAIMETDSPVELILRGGDLGEAWNHVQELTKFEDSLREHIKSLMSLKVDLEDKKGATEAELKKLVGLKNELAAQKKALDANRQETSTLLATTKNKESNYQKLLAEKTAQHKQFEQELLSYESELKLAIDPASLPKTGSGVLSWPLDAVFITQYFGNTDFSTKNPQIYNGKGHNAIDLRASPGTRIKAAASGIIEGTGDTDLACPNASYGRWILIRHNNGLSTLYAHLSVIAVT